jgi:hypothetical protein
MKRRHFVLANALSWAWRNWCFDIGGDCWGPFDPHHCQHPAAKLLVTQCFGNSSYKDSLGASLAAFTPFTLFTLLLLTTCQERSNEGPLDCAIRVVLMKYCVSTRVFDSTTTKERYVPISAYINEKEALSSCQCIILSMKKLIFDIGGDCWGLLTHIIASCQLS